LYGQEHLFSKEVFKNHDEKKRLDKAEKEDKKNPITQEMDRLRRESPMVNIFPILLPRPIDFNDNCFNIMFHNIATYRRKYQYINTDFACKNCDVLLLSECHTIPQRDKTLLLDDFDMVRISGTDDPNSACGQLCFLNKKSQRYGFKFVNDNTTAGIYKQTKDNLELSLYQMTLKDGVQVFICHVYNHPNNPRRRFWEEFKTFLRTNLETDNNKKILSKMFIMGDFNIDYDEEDSYIRRKLETTLGLKFLHNQKTTDRDTCIDWCLTNELNNDEINYDCQVYESYYSDHKPLILTFKF
jgi:exonuclease III